MSNLEKNHIVLYEHEGHRPEIHPTASIAPSAVVSGNVIIGPETRVLHGAVVSAQGGEVRIGSRCVVMENAVLRGTKRHTLNVGSNVLIGPGAYLTGCHIGDDVFLATGSTVFNGARIAHGSEVRVNGVVHLLSELPPESLVPIGWVAVGRPASVLPPNEHNRIWELQEPLNFPGEVFGIERSRPGASKMPELCRRYTKFLACHDSDRMVSNQ